MQTERLAASTKVARISSRCRASFQDGRSSRHAVFGFAETHRQLGWKVLRRPMVTAKGCAATKPEGPLSGLRDHLRIPVVRGSEGPATVRVRTSETQGLA